MPECFVNSSACTCCWFPFLIINSYFIFVLYSTVHYSTESGASACSTSLCPIDVTFCLLVSTWSNFAGLDFVIFPALLAAVFQEKYDLLQTDQLLTAVVSKTQMSLNWLHVMCLAESSIGSRRHLEAFPHYCRLRQSSQQNYYGVKRCSTN